MTVNATGQINFASSGTLTEGFAISGAGKVNQTGAGTTVLTGASTYTGGTTISAGTLQLGNGGTTGSIVGDIVDNGALRIDRSNTTTLAGVVSGTGSVTQGGSGTTVLSGANSYSGGTTVSAGTLQIASDGNLGSTAGVLTLSNGGTLAATADLASTRNVVVGTGGGTLSAANTALTFSGAFSGTGPLTVSAGAGAITLANASNHFAGAVTLAGGATLISDAAALTLGNIATGALTVISHGSLSLGTGKASSLSATSNNGAITEAGALNITGASTINAGTGAITLTHAGNDFVGAVNLTGGTTQIVDANALTLGNIATGTLSVTSKGALSLGTGSASALNAASNGNAITQGGALNIANLSTINAGAASITLTDAKNDFVGAVSLVGGTTQITDANALSLGTLGTGALTVRNSGALSLGSGSAASLDAVSNNGAITQAGALTVSGTTTLNAGTGAITLAQSGNLFVGAVSLVGGPTQIGSGADLKFGGSTIGGTLAVTSVGDVTQTGPLSVAGAASINTSKGAIALTNAGNDFRSTVALTGTDIAVVDVNDLSVSALNSGVNANVSLVAGGKLVLPNTAINAGTGTVNLAANGGTLAVGSAVTGSAVTLAGRDGLTLAGAVTATGTLTLGSSGGAVAQTAAVLTADTLTGSSAGGTLLGGVNQIGQLGAFTANGFSLTNGRSLTQTGALNGGAGGVSLTTVNGGSLNTDGAVAGATVTLVSAGALTQGNGGAVTTGTLTGSSVGATSLIGANQVDSLGTFTAAGFALRNAKALTVSGAVSGGASTSLTTTSGDLSVNAAVSGTATQLTSAAAIAQGANGVITAGTLGGSATGNATLTAANKIGALGDFTAGGSLSLANAQALTIAGNVQAGSVALDVASGIVLTGSLRATGGSVDLAAGTALQVGSAGTAGTLAGSVTGNGALSFKRSDDVVYAGNVSGGGSLTQAGTGALVLTGDATQTGGTTVASGTLRIGNGGTAGSVAGAILDNAALEFNRSDVVTSADVISGTGTLAQAGTGTLNLTAANTYTGGTAVNAGTLKVNNASGSATGTGAVAVNSGGTLGGAGAISGAVSIQAGGTLAAGNSPGTLTTGALTLAKGSTLAYELGQAGVPGGAFNDLVVVNGDLTLGGTVNVTESAGGTFGAGVYRLISYSGGLTDNGLAIGSAPVAASDLQVQTSVAQQVNLINRHGVSLNFWDGSDSTGYNDGKVAGGSGTWRVGAPGDAWTDADGNINAAWAQNQYAIFGGKAGTVTVDGSGGTVSIVGAQFMVDGYRVAGDALNVDKAGTVIRVGDGTAGGAAMTATIDSAITGTGGISKEDLGTLVLNGANTYSGGTVVKSGVLQGNSTSLQGDIVNNAVVVFDQGKGVTGTYAGTMSGTGSLRKIGEGELEVASASTYSGGTRIDAGTVNASVTGALGTGPVSVASGAELRYSGKADVGAVTLTSKTGGTIDFADNVTAASATVVNNAGGTLSIQNAAGKGVAIGAVSGAGTVVLGSKAVTTGGLNTSTEISGVISGSGGSVVKQGTGTLTLSAANTYTGGTALKQGQLNLGNNAALGTGALAMDDGTTLGFSADGLTVSNAIRLTGTNDPVIDTGTFSETLSGAISGGGFITKQGTGTLTLSGVNTYTGATNVAQGTLKAGAANTFSAASAHSVATGATLDLAGFNQTVASLANSGTVSLLGSVPGTTLTVNGNYVGNNGVLRLGTTLGATGPSDRLVISGGTASGKTSVQITNLGGLGARTTGNGIEIVTAQNGATTTAQTTKDAFSLAGGSVAAGAFEYRLYAADASGAGQNWYLRTDAAPTAATGGLALPAYRPEAALYAALPSQLRQSNLSMLGNLRLRVGDDDVKGSAPTGTGTDRRAWGRVITTDLDTQQGGTVSPSSKGHVSGFQAGTDLFANTNWRAGLYVGQLDGDAKVNGFASGIAHLRVGRNDLRNQYLGAYGTYANDTGFYADAVVQAGRHRTNVAPLLGYGTETKGSSLLASIEVGQALPVGNSSWTVEPQLQLIHQHIGLDTTQITGAIVQPKADDGWIARAGVRIKGQVDTGVGLLQPYGRVNVYRSSKGTDVARFISPAAVTDIAAPVGGTSTELAGGFTLTVSQRTSVYGEVGKLWSSGGSEKVRSAIGGSVGVRVKW